MINLYKCLLTLVIFRMVSFVKGYSMHNSHVFRKYDNASLVTVKVAQVVRAASKLGCSKECTCRKCNGFFWYPTLKQCRLVEHDYIENVQPDTHQHNFYYNQRGIVTSQLPWLFCPTRRSGVIAALTNHAEYRFFIHTTSVSYYDAQSGCNRTGGKLMKITDAKKLQVVSKILAECSGGKLMKITEAKKLQVVSKILAECSDFTKHDFWIEGMKHEHSLWQYSDGTHIPMNGSHLWTHRALDSHCKTCCLRLSAAHKHRLTSYACNDKVSGYICDIA